MKILILCLLFIQSNLVLSQIDMDPNGPLKTKIKTDSEKARMGISSQFVYIPIQRARLNISIDLFHKNKRFSIGPNFFLNENISYSNLQSRHYGYVATYNYIFPQNKNIAKAFVPIEFEHTIEHQQFFSYFNHLLATKGPGNLENPGYSFNLNTKTKTNTLTLLSGLGVYLWLNDHFYLILKALIGSNFSRSRIEYLDIDSETSLGVENSKLTLNKSLAAGSLNFGIGFKL